MAIKIGGAGMRSQASYNGGLNLCGFYNLPTRTYKIKQVYLLEIPVHFNIGTGTIISEKKTILLFSSTPYCCIRKTIFVFYLFFLLARYNRTDIIHYCTSKDDILIALRHSFSYSWVSLEFRLYSGSDFGPIL